MSRFIPSRGFVFWAFGLGSFLLVGGLIFLVAFFMGNDGVREVPGTVKEHHWVVPYKPGRAKVEFVLDGKLYFDTIGTAPFSFFSDDEPVTLLYFPNLAERLQIKGFWQQHYVSTMALGLAFITLGFAVWCQRRRRQAYPKVNPDSVPPS